MGTTGTIKAICTSAKKGTAKRTVPQAVLKENHGIEGDAHAGNWHRQVSLLSDDKIQAFKARGALVSYGCFGENIVADSIDFAALPVGTHLSCNDILLEVTQIGKECHDHCQIYHTMGECIMPKQGIFVKVLKGGSVRVGDTMTVL